MKKRHRIKLKKKRKRKVDRLKREAERKLDGYIKSIKPKDTGCGRKVFSCHMGYLYCGEDVFRNGNLFYCEECEIKKEVKITSKLH